MCEIHEAGVELLGVSVIHVTPAIFAIAVLAFVTLSVVFMRADQNGGGF